MRRIQMGEPWAPPRPPIDRYGWGFSGQKNCAFGTDFLGVNIPLFAACAPANRGGRLGERNGSSNWGSITWVRRNGINSNEHVEVYLRRKGHGTVYIFLAFIHRPWALIEPFKFPTLWTLFLLGQKIRLFYPKRGVQKVSPSDGAFICFWRIFFL